MGGGGALVQISILSLPPMVAPPLFLCLPLPLCTKAYQHSTIFCTDIPNKPHVSE